MKLLKGFTAALSIVLFGISNNSCAQPGGRSTYGFLEIINSPKIIALGGKPVGFNTGDLELALFNPAYMDPSFDGQVSLGYTNYIADINSGFAGYSRSFKKIGQMTFGANYFNYGKFAETNSGGEVIGKFRASEIALQAGAFRELNKIFAIGVNSKLIFSSFEQYFSAGMAFDVSGRYLSKDKLFSTAVLVRNAGFQFRKFSRNNNDNLPFDVQLAVSQKLEHAPVLFSIVAHSLTLPDMTWSDPANPPMIVDPLTGDLVKQKKNIPDKIMRHLVFGLEFSPVKTFYLALGYNHQRRKELIVDTRKGITGFSAGFGFMLSKFRFGYAISSYHLGGKLNTVSISTKISDFMNKGIAPTGL